MTEERVGYGLPGTIVLASASPRRRELLDQIGVRYRVRAAHVDESEHGGEAPRDYVLRVARDKAAAVWALERPAPVLAADTTVVVDGRLLAKPVDREDGLRMLEALSGRTHEVLTAVVLATAGGLAARVSSTAVTFRTTGAAERLAYWESGEPRDKAGGYAIQGFGGVFVERIVGSFSGVMGLPVFETADLLRAAGVPVWRPEAP